VAGPTFVSYLQAPAPYLYINPPAPRSGVMLTVAVASSTLNNISTAFNREVVPRVPGTSMPSKTTKRVPESLLWRRTS